MSELAEQKSDRPQICYQKWGSRAQWVSAFVAILGVLAALYAFSYYSANLYEQKNKLSADALSAWSTRQPSNTRPCLELLSKLTTNEWTKIIARKEFSVSSREGGESPLVGDARACFSDQDDLDKFLKDGSLTLRGVALLASRANAILEADDFIVSFILQKIGNQEMLYRVADLICRDDPQIIDSLPTDPRTRDSFTQLRKFRDALSPDGCRVPPRTAKP
jgi:hypothetical protein